MVLFLVALQSASPVSAAPPAPAPPDIVVPDVSASASAMAQPTTRLVPGGLRIDFEFIDPVSSKTNSSGDRVKLRTVEDVRGSQGELLIPKGSLFVAEVIQASPARMMGKAGELTLAARDLDVRGSRIPMKRFRFGASSGKGNDGAAFMATALVGLPGMLISGGNVTIAPGAHANAVVVSDTVLSGHTNSSASQQGGQ
ncbi:hypothetical protein [Sphingomonas sp. LHG3406-1]|uniref:hypothetical protein n=1 Tax=Sphingomonas sp. LHG3406-1 TaxID=2804617 RepID=UPI002610566E|nr:hypothetical protein [Sphingomonas sp. LHG3406-1]